MIVNKREKISRGTWKSPDLKNKTTTDWTRPGLSVREGEWARAARKIMWVLRRASSWGKGSS